MHYIAGKLALLSSLVLSATLLLNAAIALLFLFRQHHNKRADYFFAGLLLAFAASTFHHLLVLKGAYTSHPGLLFLPVYHTLSLGMLLFFAVKLQLFPSYQFVGSDAKHFLLPVGQVLYFAGLYFLTDVEYRLEVGRKFYSPFYGGLEMALYIVTFYAYQFGAYRYIHFKIAALRKKQEGGQMMYQAFVLRRMLRVMLLLFWINSAYIGTDFVMYELLRLNMHDFRGFTRFGDLSFAAMAGWAGLCGIQLLQKPPYVNLSEALFNWLKKHLVASR
ncbi:MAG: hypothetical protein RI973_1152 [Bacteroidota bacterium]|jgi:hypothetical protein